MNHAQKQFLWGCDKYIDVKLSITDVPDNMWPLDVHIQNKPIKKHKRSEFGMQVL